MKNPEHKTIVICPKNRICQAVKSSWNTRKQTNLYLTKKTRNIADDKRQLLPLKNNSVDSGV